MNMKETDVIYVGQKIINGHKYVTVKDPFSDRVATGRLTELNKLVKQGRVTVVRPIDNYKAYKNAVLTINRRLKEYETYFGKASKPYQNLARQVGALNMYSKSKGINNRLTTGKDLFTVTQYQDHIRNRILNLSRQPTANELYNSVYKDALKANNQELSLSNARKYAEEELNMESNIDEALTYYYNSDNGLTEQEDKWIKDTMYYGSHGGQRVNKRITLADYHKLIDLGKKMQKHYAENANVVSDPFSV